MTLLCHWHFDLVIVNICLYENSTTVSYFEFLFIDYNHCQSHLYLQIIDESGKDVTPLPLLHTDPNLIKNKPIGDSSIGTVSLNFVSILNSTFHIYVVLLSDPLN